MRPYSFKVPVGEALQIAVGKGANYIRLESASATMNFIDPIGRQETNLELGDNVRWKEFKELHISHDEATEQTIVILIGGDTSKSSSRVAGDIQIIGGANNLASPPSVIIGGGALDLNALVTNWNANISTALITIVTPAANTSGVRIDGFAPLAPAAAGQLTIMAKTSAPASWEDGGARILLYANIGGAANIQYIKNIKLPVVVPAGEGIYAQASAASVSKMSMQYEIL